MDYQSVIDNLSRVSKLSRKSKAPCHAILGVIAIYARAGYVKEAHLACEFGHFTQHWRGREIDVDAIDRYIDHRFSEGIATATINGELRYLRRMFRLACKLKKLGQIPMIEAVAG